MEIRFYLNALKRWAWLLVLGLVLGVGIGYAISLFVEPAYQARTKVLIQSAPEEQSLGVVSTNDQQLAQTFTELLVTRPVLEATSQQLNYRVSGNQVRVSAVGEAMLIQVTVEDSDPQRAADIANTLVKVFLEQNEALQASRFAASEESLSAQLKQVESQISTLQNELNTISEEGEQNLIQGVTEQIANLQADILNLEKELVALQYSNELITTTNDRGIQIQITATPVLEKQIEIVTKSSRIEELRSLLNMYQRLYVDISFSGGSATSGSVRSAEQIQSALNLYQQIHSTLLTNYEAIRLARLQSTPNVLQVEEALPPGAPVRPRPVNNMMLGGIVGLFLAGAIAFVIEHLDDSFRSPADVREILQLPILGMIGEMKPRRKGKEQLPFVMAEPRSPVTEGMRTLRANLEFMEIDKPLHSMLLASPGASEGKSTLAINLALIIAQAGKQVILVDGDLRRPSIHRMLSVPNRLGLSDVLRNRSTLQASLASWQNPNLKVLTSGSLPPNPSEVLGSEKMVRVISEMEDAAELVVIDGPPFTLADASVLSSRVDGVLMVIQMNRTTVTESLAMLDQLERAGARVLGVVINRVKGTGGTNYYYRESKEYGPLSYETNP